MRYQIFAPLFILLLLNLFWYALMWRILVRAVKGVTVADEREEGEYDEEEEERKAEEEREAEEERKAK